MTPAMRSLILCNPHNPVGRVYTREELEALLAICRKHDILILADEIHCEFDLEEGVATYEVEFSSGKYDYDYKVDATTGEVLRVNTDYDDDDDAPVKKPAQSLLKSKSRSFAETLRRKRKSAQSLATKCASPSLTICTAPSRS